MKKHIYPLFIIFLIPVSILFFSCTSEPNIQPAPNEPEISGEVRAFPAIPPEAETVLHIYEEAVRTGNRELLREILAENPNIKFTDREGHQSAMHGFDAFAEFRLAFFSDFGPREDYKLVNLIGTEGHLKTGFAIGFSFSSGIEWLSLRLENGRWELFESLIELEPPGEWVTNKYQALADYNRDGFLNEEEQNELNMLLDNFYSGPHKVSNQFDEFCDKNSSGYIEEEEIRYTADVHFVQAPLFYIKFTPGNIDNVQPFDLNKDGRVTVEELETVRDYMAGGPEIPVNRDEIIHTVSYGFFPDAVYQQVPREISSLLDKIADGNGDGIIDKGEQELIMDSLLPAYHEAGNYIERAIDQIHDGYVDYVDVTLILQDSALGRGMIAEGNEPPYATRTVIDRMLDRNGDGQVDQEEITHAVQLLSGNVELSNTVSQDLKGILDENRNGRIDTWEIEETEGILLYPRPVDPDNRMDAELDENKDGFIDPNELGITAGITNKGEIPPFEEQISFLRRQGENSAEEKDRVVEPSVKAKEAETPGKAVSGTVSEYYRNLGSIQDKKLAVVSLNVGTEKVDKETANGIIVFVENAFVNVGKVKVVDRANIQEIFKENKFQASGVVDEKTAVEIGKLSGADIIVIGSINRVGGIFYLNIKLITVKTAEIIGSSISQAEDAAEFLEMANQAVYKLF